VHRKKWKEGGEAILFGPTGDYTLQVRFFDLGLPIILSLDPVFLSGYRVGYKRVSSLLQNTDRRLDGEELGKVNEDKVSGKDTNRPALKEAMQFVRDGDVFVVHSMDRLARNLEDLKGIVKELTGRGVKVQ
jgi:hypothetical protein